MEKTQKNNKLNAKDFIFIGIFGAVALLIFFVTGAIAALTVFGTIANIPITLFLYKENHAIVAWFKRA